jgi:glycosyltransferase involved in cell wall biosynthesis
MFHISDLTHYVSHLPFPGKAKETHHPTHFTPKVAHITTIDLSLRCLLLNQLRSIQQAGYEVVGISSPGPDVSALEAAGIRHLPVSMTRNVTPLADLASLWQLYRIMRRERFTIVHAHTPKAELLGQVAARLAGVPIVVDTFRGIYFRNGMHLLWRRLFMAMARIAAARADIVLSQSSESIGVAMQEGLCPPEKIKFLGNGIDVRRFDRNRLDETVLAQKRAELGLSPESPVVGFVGRLVREKGILELLQAIQTVRQHVPTVRLLIIGPIDIEKPDALTPQLAQEYDLAECCIFTGMRHDMPELYALMDVFALPSHRESFPRSPMEASAMGVPSVVTDIPGCRETVEHNRNGLLTPLGDVPALAQTIIELFTRPEKAKQMAVEGRRMALTRFDEQFVFDKVKAEYQRLLRAKGFVTKER